MLTGLLPTILAGRPATCARGAASGPPRGDIRAARGAGGRARATILASSSRMSWDRMRRSRWDPPASRGPAGRASPTPAPSSTTASTTARRRPSAIAGQVPVIDRMVVERGPHDPGREVPARPSSSSCPTTVARFDPADRDEMLRPLFLAKHARPSGAVPGGRDPGQPRAATARRVRRRRPAIRHRGVLLAPGRGCRRRMARCRTSRGRSPSRPTENRGVSEGWGPPDDGAASDRGTRPSTSAGSAGATCGA